MLIALPAVLSAVALSIAGQASGQPSGQSPAEPATTRHTQAHVIMRGAPDGRSPLARDEDGFISREAFVAPLADAFARLDKDGDGRLSPEELTDPASDGDSRVMIFGGAAPGEGGAALQRFTLRRPAGGEGRDVIGSEGRIVVVPTTRGPGAAPMSGLDALDLDADGDGRVSEEEFLARFRDAFRRMDQDGSGHLEDGERDGARVLMFTHRTQGPGTP